jgi:hypothetical protein
MSDACGMPQKPYLAVEPMYARVNIAPHVRVKLKRATKTGIYRGVDNVPRHGDAAD